MHTYYTMYSIQIPKLQNKFNLKKPHGASLYWKSVTEIPIMITVYHTHHNFSAMQIRVKSCKP